MNVLLQKGKVIVRARAKSVAMVIGHARVKSVAMATVRGKVKFAVMAIVRGKVKFAVTAIVRVPKAHRAMANADLTRGPMLVVPKVPLARAKFAGLRLAAAKMPN